MNLLSVDWDYFFHNPLRNQEPRHDVLLYDWGHREAPFFIDSPLWEVRAAGFLSYQLGLPLCSGYEDFWDRFEIFPNAPLYVADSHAHAGNVMPTPWHRWGHVYNFDAHHDCGYKKETANTLPKDGPWDCSNWMLRHRSQRHVRYPDWFVNWRKSDPRPSVRVDRRLTDWDEQLPLFHAAFLCRSGAWVPPWCDDRFEELMEQWPGPIERMDEGSLMRKFDLYNAQQQAAQMGDARKLRSARRGAANV